MDTFYKIIISDYKQRTRSYAFLVTLAISLYAAYAFVPGPDAGYNTVRIGNYVGVQNSAWIGYVTAMMTSVFLSWIGFYLINSSIKKDVDTGVGMIIATTSISNLGYLFAKAWSNFLVLLTIMAMVFLMSLAIFFIRPGHYPFEPLQFILPYLIITIPSLFQIASLAVLAEVFLNKHTILMNIGFFFLFCFIVSMQLSVRPAFDVFGVKPVTAAMHNTVLNRYKDTSSAVSIGFNFGPKKEQHSFEFTGINWPVEVILSRLLFTCLGLAMIFISSKFFHRFDIKQRFKAKKKSKFAEIIPQVKLLKEIKLSELPAFTPSYRIIPFIKTELLMLFRKGPRWLWLLNIGGMISLIFVQLPIAHQVILPVLWFFQVGRLSDLATKEKTNRIHYFTYASYKPLTRLLPAQVAAGVILAVVLASPLIVRYLVYMQWLQIAGIIMGAVFIVLFAVALGILSGGKKLFEILFFLFTYCNIEKIPFADYFGSINHGANYLAFIATLIVFLAILGFGLRRMEIRKM